MSQQPRGSRYTDPCPCRLPHRLGVLALVAVAVAVLGALGGTVPAAGAAGGGAAGGGDVLTLLSQSQWVVPAQPGAAAAFDIELGTGGNVTGSVSVTVYNKLTSRSGRDGFEETLTGQPATGVLARTGTLSLDSLPAGHNGGSELALDVVTQATGSSGTSTIGLACSPGNGTCPGVYPVVVSLERQPGGPVVAHLTTYLTYAESVSGNPLRFAWVVPVATQPTIRGGASSPAKALGQPSHTALGSLEGLVQSLKHYGTVPVTVEAVPETLQALDRSGPTGAKAVSDLAALSGDQQVHEFVAQPYVPIDLGALAGAGVGTEIAGQMGTGKEILQTAGIRTSAGTWVASGPVGADLAKGLTAVGATDLVLPDNDVAAGQEIDGITWSQPFKLTFPHAPAVTAMASDGELAAHFTADPGDPALAATQLLADLAFIHFELPNSVAARGVVAVPPPSWTPDTQFVDTLLKGLQGNPDVQAATLNTLFTTVQAGANGASLARRLTNSGSGPVLTTRQAQAVVRARLRLTAFDGAAQAPAARPVLTALDDILLASESSLLAPARQRAGVTACERQLAGQLALVQLATNRTITLTARTAPIPITILSSAPYPLQGRLVLSSDRFEFPHGATRTLPIDHNTNSIRVDVEARTTGDLPLEVVLTSPNGGLVITQGRLTVRSTATSIVGIVLTLAAAAVLLGWWARTWRASRRRRRTGKGAGRVRDRAVPTAAP